MSSFNEIEPGVVDAPSSARPRFLSDPEDQKIFVDFNGMIEIIGIKVSRSTIWRWIKEGRFPKATKLAGSLVAWKRCELLAWLDQQYENRHSIHRAEIE